MKQKWENPNVTQMNIGNTNEAPETFDMPHPHICDSCGIHYTAEQLKNLPHVDGGKKHQCPCGGTVYSYDDSVPES